MTIVFHHLAHSRSQRILRLLRELQIPYVRKALRSREPPPPSRPSVQAARPLGAGFSCRNAFTAAQAKISSAVANARNAAG